MTQERKGLWILLAALSASLAVWVTDWRGGHPIGSFAESFVAAALMALTLTGAVVTGVKTKARLDASTLLYRFSGLAGWLVGITVFIVLAAIISFIPGVSDAVDRFSD